MKLSLCCKKSIKALFLILSLIILTGCYSRGKHPRMPDVDPKLVSRSFSNAMDILVLPLWEIIPFFYTENVNPLHLISSPFISPDLQYVSSNIERPESWNIVTPGFRVGNKTQILRGIYLLLKNGETVWLRASQRVGDEGWCYIKWASMSKQWKHEIETAIGKGKASRNKESNTDFWGAEYGSDMRIIVDLTDDEKKMVKEYLDSINYGNITNGGQWKLVTE